MLADAVARLGAASGVPVPPPSPGALIALVAAAECPTREDIALAVREGVAELARRRPGKSVEVRVPPHAAAQIGGGDQAGPGAGRSHTRGTPPAVVECDAATFLALAAGRLDFGEAVAAHRVRASGAHSDVSGLFPL